MASIHSSIIVTSPEGMNRTFAEAYNSGSIENLLQLYKPDACLVSITGEACVGIAAIEADLRGLLELKGHMTSENQYMYRTGDIALLRAQWHLVGTQSDGEPLSLQGTSTEVVQQQPDGRWLYIIDHPFGVSDNF